MKSRTFFVAVSGESLIWMTVSLVLCCGAASAQTCAAPPSGMIAWWTLDETSGIVAKDSVGTEPAAYFGTPAPVQTPGLVNGAIQFNGSNDFLSAPASNLWSFGTSDFTVELWANFAAVPGGDLVHAGAIFIGDDDGPGAQNKWFFALGGGLLHFTVYNTAAPPPNFYLVRAPFVPIVGQWYHLAVTKTGTTFTIYVNGVAVGSEISLSPIASPSAPLTIGQAESLGFMNGILDEISVYNRALSQAELQAIANAGSAGKCKLATATAISPSVGGNAGQVSVTLSGSQFSPTSTVQLSTTGLPGIVGSTPTVSPDGTSLSTIFDLTGQPLGVRDVVVTAPNLPTVTLPKAFTIEPARPPNQIWAAIVGRGAIRVGQIQEFTILYGNRGDMDALDVPIRLSGIPTTATFTPEFTLIQPPTVPGWPPFDSSSPIAVTTDTDIQVPLIINRIPPGAVGTLKFSLLVVDATPIHLVATASQPLASFVPASPAAAGAGSASLLNPSVQNCFTDVCGLILDSLGITKTLKCLTQGASFVATFLTLITSDGESPEQVVSELSLGVGGGQTMLKCAAVLIGDIPEAKLYEAVSKVIGDLLKGKEIGTTVIDCNPLFFGKPYQIDTEVLDVMPVFSFDPNAKQGLQGIGTLHYLSSFQPWPYTIVFENEATASAPAQSVSVTDQLDTAHLDLNTFSLGPIGFGAQQVVPPPGLSQFSSYVDLRPATSLLVGINASLNKVTGLVTWSFNSLDPSTGQPPTDPTVGFLPPNVVSPEGDGQVLFSVSPLKSLNTGLQISNSASVVFDVNPPVVTPSWSNTLDSSPPVSHVLPLPTDEATQNFIVQWTGTDVGSGIANFTVFVSDNGSPFTVWQDHTSATSATYNGQFGHTYAFYSIAADNTGNLEPAKSAPDATTQVGFNLQLTAKVEITGTPPTSFQVNGSLTLATGSNGINPVTQAVTLQVGTYSVSIPAGSFRKTSKGVFVYQGSIGGVALQVRIAPVTGTSFTFQAEGSGANLTGTVNPVTLMLTIGDNIGSAVVMAQFQ